jgi:hypothetical protein
MYIYMNNSIKFILIISVVILLLGCTCSCKSIEGYRNREILKKRSRRRRKRKCLRTGGKWINKQCTKKKGKKRKCLKKGGKWKNRRCIIKKTQKEKPLLQQSVIVVKPKKAVIDVKPKKAVIVVKPKKAVIVVKPKKAVIVVKPKKAVIDVRKETQEPVKKVVKITEQQRVINNKFNQFKKSISDEMCKCKGVIYPENSACKYNFNKCVNACYPSMKTKIDLLTELGPLKECKDKISSDEIKTKLQNIGKCSTHLKKINDFKNDSNMVEMFKAIGKIANHCGNHATSITPNLTNPSKIRKYLGGELYKIIDETKKSEGSSGCTNSHITGLKKDVTDIPGYFLSEYRKIGKKYIEENSESCKKKRGKEGAILSYDINEFDKKKPKDCCHAFFDCHDFMTNELSNKKVLHATACGSKNSCQTELKDHTKPSTDSSAFKLSKECTQFAPQFKKS